MNTMKWIKFSIARNLYRIPLVNDLLCYHEAIMMQQDCRRKKRRQNQ